MRKAVVEDLASGSERHPAVGDEEGWCKREDEDSGEDAEKNDEDDLLLGDPSYGPQSRYSSA